MNMDNFGLVSNEEMDALNVDIQVERTDEITSAAAGAAGAGSAAGGAAAGGAANN